MKSINTLSLLVKNYDEALAFYTEKLGFEVRDDFPFGESDRWLTIGLPNQKELDIALCRPKKEEELSLVGKQNGSFPLFSLSTDDIIADYARMKANGVRFDDEPHEEPWGGRGASCEDLYGNSIYLYQEEAGK